MCSSDAYAPYPYPISYKGEYHYRSGSTKQELKGAALDKFLMRKQGITWDAVPVPGVKITDLNEKALNYFREQAIHNQRLPNTLINESSAGLLEKLRLTTGDYLKRAAIMLFHPEPDYFVTGAVIKIGAFGTSNADLLHHDEITGNLFTQVEEALEVIKLKYLKASISYGELYRKERFPLPIPALREALLNAVVHKDYASHTAIQISIYPNKLMLWNPGQLPESWTLEKLLSKHESPVCQHRPEPLDFEITYRSGQSGAHYAKTSDTDRIQSGAESFLRKTHPSRVYARV